MPSLFPAFTSAATGYSVHPSSSILWLIIFAIAVLDDEKRREKERRRKRQAVLRAQLTPKPKAAFAPRPW